MKPPILFISFFPLLGLSQFHLYSDFYIAPDTELHITAPTTTLMNGSFLTDHGSAGGVVSFSSQSQVTGTDHNTHVDGNVRVYAPDTFTFAVGHDRVFQPLTMSESTGVSFITLDYRHLAHTDLSPTTGLIKIHPAHYWSLHQGSGTAKVHLSWNEFSQIDSFLEGTELEDLTVVGYKNGTWELIPSELSPQTSNSKLSGVLSSQTPISLADYSALALAVKGIKGVDGSSGYPRVAEGISPNGDGDNDTWYIEGIENFPQARIYVYNRTGERVFQALNGYLNDWIGDWKERGIPLPSAPYFYTIDLDADGEVDMSGWLYIQN